MGVKDKVLVFIRKGYPDLVLFLEQNFDCRIFEGDWGDPFPNIDGVWLEDLEFDTKFSMDKLDYDWVFSWLCPWKIPPEILKLAKKGAINFHPGPPKYPGIGCYNYAIWNGDDEYAVLCHYMNDKMDNGDIIWKRGVVIYENDTIETLKNRSINKLKDLFYDVMWHIINDHPLHSNIKYEWGEYRSREYFQKFCEIDLCFDDYIMLERTVKAFYFKGARDLPYIEVNGKKWCLVPEEDLLG